MEHPAIEARGLSRSYGRVKAISDLRLTIDPGEKVVLIGPNGSGKTTLIKLLSTLIRPTSGTLELFGKDTASHGAQLRQRVGVLLHEPLLYNRLTALENLHFYSKMFNVPNEDRRIWELAEEMDIGDLLRTRVESLSHGQRKRVSILRALLHDPSLLLLDEPDAGLDQTAVQGLVKLASRNGRTVVMSTHNLENGLRMAQRVIVLKKGKVIMDVDGAALDRADLGLGYEALVTG